LVLKGTRILGDQGIKYTELDTDLLVGFSKNGGGPKAGKGKELRKKTTIER